jgi:hydrogenase-4 component E
MGGWSGAAEVAHGLGGAVLALSFVLLYQRRLTGLINACAAQFCVLAAALAWQGWVQASPALALTGLIVLAVAGVAAPVVLHRIAGLLQIDGAVAAWPGIFPVLAAGVALVVLAVLLALPAPAKAWALAREDLALALSVVLLGQLMMIVWHGAPAQVVGFLSMVSGLLLGAAGVRGMPLVPWLAAALLALAGAAVGGVFVLRLRARFEDAEAGGLDRLGRARR